jgi:hypothetical protein
LWSLIPLHTLRDSRRIHPIEAGMLARSRVSTKLHKQPWLLTVMPSKDVYLACRCPHRREVVLGFALLKKSDEPVG